MLPKIKTILYASDISPGSRPAFRMAVEQALKHDAQIVFIHALEPFNGAAAEMIDDYLPRKVSAAHTNAWLNSYKERITERIQSFLDEELPEGTQLPYPTLIKVLVGPPAKVIVRSADKLAADLIVMGERSASTASRIFLGSTAQKVLHHTQIPVLIVPLNSSKNSKKD
ncbi:Universal stress protein family [Marinobacterium lacunae]|uniref:Universal stress protein family n=1 Tax=Marinobacterium lacunae TaxID=1232683 RepID=A0A081G371_9GAMM|nr:universal stress protein [Marinobacterium lacunae]KEA65226.1 Universal stress protein family [Marinobacterium lacunae]